MNSRFCLIEIHFAISRIHWSGIPVFRMIKFQPNGDYYRVSSRAKRLSSTYICKCCRIPISDMLIDVLTIDQRWWWILMNDRAERIIQKYENTVPGSLWTIFGANPCTAQVRDISVKQCIHRCHCRNDIGTAHVALLSYVRFGTSWFKDVHRYFISIIILAPILRRAEAVTDYDYNSNATAKSQLGIILLLFRRPP